MLAGPPGGNARSPTDPAMGRGPREDAGVATGRFAPSPTGALHLGNLRTALLAWLFARRSGSRFLVRIEDLEARPGNLEHEAQQLRDLASLGLDWDGPVVRQSALRPRHEAAVAELTARGLTYPCFCSRREVREAAAAPHGQPTGRYPGTCRDLDEERRRAGRAEGRPAAVRLRSDGAVVTIVDWLRGPVTATVDDVVLRRNDGVPAYNLAVVIDDADQGVEEVVRGDDLLDSTPPAGPPGRPARAASAPRGPTCPSWSARMANAWPSGTGRSRWPTSPRRASPPEAVLGRLAASLGLAAAGEQVTPADVLERFDPGALPTEPWVLA